MSRLNYPVERPSKQGDALLADFIMKRLNCTNNRGQTTVLPLAILGKLI